MENRTQVKNNKSKNWLIIPNLKIPDDSRE
jgi:hypothetical protein